jgi:hypothetical protein
VFSLDESVFKQIDASVPKGLAVCVAGDNFCAYKAPRDHHLTGPP